MRKRRVYVNGGVRDWKASPSPVHASPDVKIIVCQRGAFVVGTRSADYEVTEGSAIVIPAGLHCRLTAEASVRILVIVSPVTSPGVKFPSLRRHVPTIRHPMAKDLHLLEQLHAYCMELSVCSEPSARQLLARLAECWVSILQRAPERRKVLPCHDALQRARRCITEDFHQPIRIQDLARRVGLSETHFRRSYRLAFGVGPKEEILHLRIRKAQSLLMETNLKLADVAFQCGFSDEHEFSRSFQRRLGMPPGLWRRS